jgi:hypothetical protein
LGGRVFVTFLLQSANEFARLQGKARPGPAVHNLSAPFSSWALKNSNESVPHRSPTIHCADAIYRRCGITRSE